jgi:hypothetical protein
MPASTQAYPVTKHTPQQVPRWRGKTGCPGCAACKHRQTATVRHHDAHQYSSSAACEDRCPYVCNPGMTQTQAPTNSKPAQADKTLPGQATARQQHYPAVCWTEPSCRQEAYQRKQQSRSKTCKAMLQANSTGSVHLTASNSKMHLHCQAPKTGHLSTQENTASKQLLKCSCTNTASHKQATSASS